MELREDDCYVSYLPAAHVFEQIIFGMAVVFGFKVGFYSGDPRKMATEDLPYL